MPIDLDFCPEQISSQRLELTSVALSLKNSEVHGVPHKMARVGEPQGLQVSLQAVAHKKLALKLQGCPCSNLCKGSCLPPSALSHASYVSSGSHQLICARSMQHIVT